MKKITFFEVILIVAIVIFLFLYFYKNIFKNDADKIIDINRIQSVDLIQMSPPNLKVYHCVNKYAPEFDIPFKYAFGIVREETSYNNPLDYTYNHSQTSPTGAEGPFQFIPSTARYVSGDQSLTRKEIRNNIDLNTKLAMEYARSLYDRYHSWNVAFGYYNTGYPIINSYARRITS